MQMTRESDTKLKMEKKLKDSEEDFLNLMQEEPNFSSRYHLLVDNSFKSDVTFIFEDEKVINAHQLLLSTSSKVFCAMFNESWGNYNKIPIQDISSEIFKELLYFIYANKVNNLTEENGLEMMYAAHKYELIHLENIICDFLIEKISINNACSFYEKSLLFNNKLTECAEEFIKKKTEPILKSQSFLSLQLETVKRILSMQSLAVDEHDLFIRIIKWAKDVCIKNGVCDTTAGNIRLFLNGAEKLIRFPTMTVENFVKCTDELPSLLSNDEIAKIIFSITSPHLYDLSSLQFSQIKRNRLNASWDYDWDLNIARAPSSKYIEKFEFMVDSSFKIKSIFFKQTTRNRSIYISTKENHTCIYQIEIIPCSSCELLIDNDSIYFKDTWYEIVIAYQNRPYGSVHPPISSADTKNINEKNGQIKLQWASSNNISIKKLSLSIIS